MNWKSAVAWLQKIFFVLTWLIIGYFLYKNWDVITQALTVRRPLLLILSLLFTFLGFYLQVWSRSIILKALKIPLSIAEQSYIMAHNNILKYLPGGVWNQLDAMALLRKNTKISLFVSGKVVFVEMYWRVVWGYVLFAPLLLTFNPHFLIFDFQFNWGWYLLSLLTLLIVTYFVGRKHPSIHLYSWRFFLDELVSNTLFWISSGISLALMVYAFGTIPFSVNSFSLITGANALSWVAGFLFLPAPSGIGVREYVLALLLSPYREALVVGVSISLLNRVLILIRDIIIFIYTHYLLSKNTK